MRADKVRGRFAACGGIGEAKSSVLFPKPCLIVLSHQDFNRAHECHIRGSILRASGARGNVTERRTLPFGA